MHYQIFPLIGINRLNMSPFVKSKQCQKSITLNNHLKVFFDIDLKLIKQYKRKYPSLMAKCNIGTYQTG